MPDDLVLVFETQGDTSIYMHSIDASEAVRLGDYSYEAPGGREVTAEERATALARARGVSSTPHPELQTPEERAATRAAANEAASQQLTALPLGTPVLVQPHTPTAATPAATPPPTAAAPPAPATTPEHSAVRPTPSRRGE